MSHWFSDPEVEYEVDYDIATCGGCGRYGELGRTHVRNGEECGEFV
jgi:hypothetical protein